MIDSGNFHKKPANTIKSGASFVTLSKTCPSLNSVLEKTSVGTFKLLALSITWAIGLFVYTLTT